MNLIIYLKKLNEYQFELIRADNKSPDNTREIIDLCSRDNRVKVIFNIINFEPDWLGI